MDRQIVLWIETISTISTLQNFVMFTIDVNTQDRKCRDIIPTLTVQYRVFSEMGWEYILVWRYASAGRQSPDCVTSYTQPAAARPASLSQRIEYECTTQYYIGEWWSADNLINLFEKVQLEICVKEFVDKLFLTEQK